MQHFSLFPLQRNEPATYAVGVLSATAPSTDTRVGSVGEQVVKEHLTKLLVGGDGPLSSERRESCAQRPPLYPLSKLCNSASVDPETSVNMMNVRVQHGRVVVHARGSG